MIARVVTKREDARLALATSITAAVGLAAVVVDDILHGSFFAPPDPGIYKFIALLIALGGIGPWLAWPRRGRATGVRCEPGLVTAGRVRIAAKDVTAFTIAEGARGCSVAIARSKQLTFLEVERREDATRIAEALELPSVPFGEVTLPRASRWLAIVQAVLSVAAVIAGPLYYSAATYSYPLRTALPEGKTLFGLGGFFVAELAMILLVVRHLVPGHVVAVARGTWDAHVALHRANAATEAVAKEAKDHAAENPVRVGNLGRGDEPVGAWLARIDAIPTEQHAYRGDAMKKDVLWDTLGDSGAPVDTRMAAARVLRRRYQEEEVALVRVVDDPDVRLRVEAALDDHEDAERRLETLGPLFRAR